MTSRILIFHTLEWTNAARMALAFKSIGCSVSALCLRGHPLRTIASLERVYDYNPLVRIRSLRMAIEDADPDLVIPCDDTAVILLHRLYRLAGKQNQPRARIRALIERSLGAPDNYQLITTRSMLPRLAQSGSVLLPRTASVTSLRSLKEWLLQEEAPAVLKADHSWGGWGVRIIPNAAEAKAAFRSMTGIPHVALAAKRLLWDRDPELSARLVRRRRSILTIQAFINGTVANCSVACWQGTVVASVAVEVLAAHGPTGNATVVRVTDNRDMIETASRIVQQISGSGLFGFDFILEEGSGRAFLLEVNPRATQISHLALGKGHDLAAALHARLVDEPVRDTPPVTQQRMIAFFPQELRRDPSSRFLRSAYHDMPDEETALVQAFLAPPRGMRRIIGWVRTRQARARSRTKRLQHPANNAEQFETEENPGRIA